MRSASFRREPTRSRCFVALVVALCALASIGCKQAPSPAVLAPDAASTAPAKPPAKVGVPTTQALRLMPGTGPEEVKRVLADLGPAARYSNGMIFLKVEHEWYDRVTISVDKSTGIVETGWMFHFRPKVLDERTIDSFADDIEGAHALLRPKYKETIDHIKGTYRISFGGTRGKYLTAMVTLEPYEFKNPTLHVPCRTGSKPACSQVIRALVTMRLPPP